MFRQVWELVPQNIDMWALFPISPPERLTLMILLVATSVQSWVSSSLHRGEDKSMKSKNRHNVRKYLRNTAGTLPVPPTGSPYTGRFFETRWSPEAVILSAAKDLRLARREILRCAQDDTSHLAGSFPKKPTRVRTGSPAPTIHGSGRPIRRMVGAGLA